MRDVMCERCEPTFIPYSSIALVGLVVQTGHINC